MHALFVELHYLYCEGGVRHLKLYPPVAFDLCQSDLQTLFEKAGGVRLALDGAN
jgi:hypothetical protein